MYNCDTYNKTKIIKPSIFCVVLIMMLTLLYGIDVKAEEINILGEQGVMSFVVIDGDNKKSMEPKVKKAIKEICEGKNICKILFWNSIEHASSCVPMTEFQVSKQVATWSQNTHTKQRKLLWSCRLDKGSNCF